MPAASAFSEDSVTNIVIVLDRPQNVSNIGATVRAMMNMGFSTLRLVDPKPFEREQVLRIAHRSDAFLDAIQIFSSLDEALRDVTLVVGASTRAQAGKPFTTDMGALSAEFASKARSARVALLFGTEADGLDHMALDRCHKVAALPVDPAYPSLNLAQAVLIFLYELRRVVHADESSPSYVRAETFTPERGTPQGSEPRDLTRQAATAQADLQRLFAMTETMLHKISFFRYNPEFVMRTLRDLTFRAAPAPGETALLVSIVRRMIYAMDEANASQRTDSSTGERPESSDSD